MALFNIRKKNQKTSPFAVSQSAFSDPSQMSSEIQSKAPTTPQSDPKKSSFLKNNDLIKGAATGILGGAGLGPIGMGVGAATGAATSALFGKKSQEESPSQVSRSFPVSQSAQSDPTQMSSISQQPTVTAAPTLNLPQATTQTGSTQPAAPTPQQTATNRQQEGINAGLTGADLQRFVETGEMPTQQATLSTAVADSPAATTPTTTSTPAVSPEQQRLNEAQERYTALLGPDSAITALKADLANFQAAAESQIAGEEGQGRGRTTSLVRGRQALLKEQAAIEEANKIAILNFALEERAQAQQAALTELGFAQDEVNRIINQQTPFEFGGNLVQYNPATGELTTIAEAPTSPAEGFTLSPGEARYDANGNLIAVGLEEPTDPLAQEKQRLEIQKLQQELQGGGDMNQMLTIKEITDLGLPTSLFGITKGQAIQAIQSGSVSTPAQQTAQQTLDAINTVLNHPGLSGVVGLQSPNALLNIPGTQASDFKAAFETLKGLLTVENLGLMSGVLSESDIKILQSAATSLNTSMSEQAFKAELERLKQGLQTGVNAVGSSGFSTQEQQALQSMLNEGLITPQEYQELTGSFSNDLGTSQKGSVLELGAITGYGSPLWEHGLDIDLKKGDPVPSPASGVVTFVGPNGGFGNQVKIMDKFGNEHWLAHLDATGVQVGQQIAKGSVIGLGGNTGSVIPMGGGDGSHLDYTVVNARGQFIPPAQIEQHIKNNIFV